MANGFPPLRGLSQPRCMGSGSGRRAGVVPQLLMAGAAPVEAGLAGLVG
jgi:hypothetical protein